MAVYTLAPAVKRQYLTDAGLPLSGGLLYTVAAGGSYPADAATTYQTSAGTAHTNPIQLDSAGRVPGSSEIYLQPGTSQKWILKNSAGVTIWTQDNIGAVPPSSVNQDIDGTAAVALEAGELAFQSDGSNSLNAGQWYKADADLPYASLPPTVLGFPVVALGAGDSGTFRTGGAIETFTQPLTPGTDYYASSTAGEITSTPPSNQRWVGRAASATTLNLAPNPGSMVQPGVVQGRLTLTSNTPVTSGDVTAATTVYFTPYRGNAVNLYSGSAWKPYTFSQVSIAVPNTMNTMYDVFLYDNAGVLTLEAASTTRTDMTGLTLTNGVYLKTGALTRLWLGSFRTTGSSGQTEDSAVNRLLYNAFNRVRRPMVRLESTASWQYTTATIRQANASASNQLAVLVGVQESSIDCGLVAMGSNTNAGSTMVAGIGYDTTTAYTSAFSSVDAPSANNRATLVSRLVHMPSVGYHFYSWNESSQAAGTTTFYGVLAGATGYQAGLEASWES